MPVKVMGIAAGRKNSNNELWLKEALMRGEAAGYVLFDGDVAGQ